MRLICRPVLAVFLSAAPAIAADSGMLKPMFVPGMRWTFDATTSVALDNKATLNGQTQPFTIKTSQHRIGHAEVVSATDGVLSSLRVTFDDASHDDVTIATNVQSKNFPYAGKTVTISRAANGEVTDDFNDQVPHDATLELHGLLDTEIVFLPTHPVAVGGEWQADGPTLARVLQLSGDERAGMKLKLLGEKSIDGRDVAELKVSTVCDRRQGEMQIQMVLQGTALVDLKTGHAIKSDLTGTLQDHGDQPGPGPDGAQVNYSVEGGGTMSAATTAPLVGGASAAATPTAAPAENPLGAPAADPFAGTFTDGKLTVTGATKDGGYVASLTLGDQKYPATATIQNHSLSGSFDASGHPFTFNATLDGDVMTMETGGKTYALKRTAVAAPPAPVNPLGSAGPPAASPKLPGYAVVVSIDAGKTMTTNKPQAHDATAAFKAVFPDLAKYFDGRPTLESAFQDTRDRNAATAAFAARLNGQPVRGLVSSHITDAGAAIVVTYCRADADRSAWAKLTESSSPADPVPALKTYTFPDNTGSVGIAPGWTPQGQSALQETVIKGPADQTITMCASFSVQSPNSQLVQMMQQTAATERQMGRNPIPQPPMLIAPYTGPVDAMRNIIPQVCEMSRGTGVPAIKLDHVEQVSAAPASMPNGQAAVLTYDVASVLGDGTAKHYRAQSLVETSPFGNGCWMMSITEASAPTERFERDIPTMLAMINSRKENQAVCAQIIQANGQAQAQAQQQQFEQGQQAHRDQMASYDAHNKAWAAGEVDKSRQNADVVEVIRGERTVLDTTTGGKGSADLGNVNQIVDQLNANEPGRYQQIPLRDELYPAAGQ